MKAKTKEDVLSTQLNLQLSRLRFVVFLAFGKIGYLADHIVLAFELSSNKMSS